MPPGSPHRLPFATRFLVERARRHGRRQLGDPRSFGDQWRRDARDAGAREARKRGSYPNPNLERWHLKAGPCYIPGTTHAYLVGMEFRQYSCLAGGAIA